ncbi:MAG: flavodoxin family protein [Sedimentisphaerales bacterium]|nr:flavodoxin family protein [Sedimentisphaerales bacterium]
MIKRPGHTVGFTKKEGIIVKILGMACSPRRMSNTSLLLDHFLDGVSKAGAEVARVDAARLDIKACTQCDECHKTGVCVLQDDMVGLYSQLERADAVVMAAPIYFMAHCAQAKLVIDRCQAFWARKYILRQEVAKPHRPGVFISVGATHGPKVFAGVKITMKWWFDCMDMDYWADLLFEGVDKAGAIAQEPGALDQAEALGRRLVLDFGGKCG